MAPCKAACSRRMSRRSSAFSVWPLLTMVALLLWTGVPGHAGPVPVLAWDPGFRTEQNGGHVVVAFYHHYENATAYEVKVTHLFSICDKKIIKDSEVGKQITFDVTDKKCGTPMRVGVIALTNDNKPLTDTVETLLPDPAPADSTPTKATPGPELETTGPTPSGPFPFTLLACVLVAVILIAAAVGFLYLKKRREGLSGSPENNSGFTGSPLEMHPIYLPGDDIVTVFVELLMELLCAHANVHVKSYRDSEEAIRSDPGAWVEGRMRRPLIFFRSPGLSLTCLSAEKSDHYGVVKHALTKLNNSPRLVVVDVIREMANQRNNARGAGSDGSASYCVLNLTDGADVEGDFERLVRKLHKGRDYPQRQMDNWQGCCIFQHLKQICSRPNETEVSVERVSCRCREANPEASAMTDPLLGPGRCVSEV